MKVNKDRSEVVKLKKNAVAFLLVMEWLAKFKYNKMATKLIGFLLHSDRRNQNVFYIEIFSMMLKMRCDLPMIFRVDCTWLIKRINKRAPYTKNESYLENWMMNLKQWLC